MVRFVMLILCAPCSLRSHRLDRYSVKLVHLSDAYREDDSPASQAANSRPKYPAAAAAGAAVGHTDPAAAGVELHNFAAAAADTA